MQNSPFVTVFGPPTAGRLPSALGIGVDPHHELSRQRAGAAQVSCRTAPAIDHTEPSSIAAKPASSPAVLRHLRHFSCSVTSLEAMTVFACRTEHGLSDGVWYALEALPCMVESNDASALCVRFGLSQEDLDALLSECGCLTGDKHKAATFKAGIKHLTGETVQVFYGNNFLPELHARVKYARAHTTQHITRKPDLSGTVPYQRMPGPPSQMRRLRR